MEMASEVQRTWSEYADEIYEDRNLLALLLCSEIELMDVDSEAGFWVCLDDNLPEWPVLMIRLPLLVQISYHMPRALIERWAGAGTHWCDSTQPCWEEHKWDGHTTEEKRQRIRDYFWKES